MSLSDEAERRLTDSPETAHLATSVDDRPHVAPVWYAYDDGTLWVTTGGRKLANLRRNPRVAVSVDASEHGDAEWMVAMQGTARVVEEGVADPLGRIFERYLGPDVAEWDDYYRRQVENADPEGTLVRIDVASATYETYE